MGLLPVAGVTGAAKSIAGGVQSAVTGLTSGIAGALGGSMLGNAANFAWRGAIIKGIIKNDDTGEIRPFQYNPEVFQHSRGAEYVEMIAPGMAYPLTQFVKGQAKVFMIELFMWDKPWIYRIDDMVQFLEKLLPPEKNSKDYKKPPTFTFCYGWFIKKCVLEKLDIKVEEFDTFGGMTQARLTLTIRQVSP